jgi:protein-glucosylgalactosylhydroxylysine glucosidase
MNFWTRGAAVELSESRDKRAFELERRIILSQYLTAINCSGSLPPQETGLTANSWYGKFHLEMHWWHAAQFALWNRLPMLENSLDWYARVLPSARERARQQGYAGARWAKMTDATGRDSPSGIGPLLIWQQPHPIFYAELCYQLKPTRATLLKFKQVVEETAEFMASYAYFDAGKNRYVLGPPVIPAQENHPARETWNPTYELEYWNYGLKKANEWRERLRLKRNPKWDEVVKKLSPLPVKDGVYMAHENCPQTFTERNIDHPSMLAAYGVLTGEMVDRETMRRTLKKVMKEWTWDDTWGWDYPMTAMTAARLGETAIAVDALLLDTPKNHYAANGHNYQRPNLPLYLPGNGGLLYAVALMANGWKDAPRTNAPGFPKDWIVKAEGFNAALFQKI